MLICQITISEKGGKKCRPIRRVLIIIWDHFLYFSIKINKYALVWVRVPEIKNFRSVQASDDVIEDKKQNKTTTTKKTTTKNLVSKTYDITFLLFRKRDSLPDSPS